MGEGSFLAGYLQARATDSNSSSGIGNDICSCFDENQSVKTIDLYLLKLKVVAATPARKIQAVALGEVPEWLKGTLC